MGETPPTRNTNIAIFASTDGRVHTIGDIVAAAHFRGELDAPCRRLLQQLSTEEAADDREMEIDDWAVQALSDEFRSDRDLSTKSKSKVKVKDLKPRKDAIGGRGSAASRVASRVRSTASNATSGPAVSLSGNTNC